jgi:hypothetical protein
MSEQAAMCHGMNLGHHHQEGAKSPRHDQDSPVKESEHKRKVLQFCRLYIQAILTLPVVHMQQDEQHNTIHTVFSVS